MMAYAILLRSFHLVSSFLLLSPMALAIPNDSEALLRVKRRFNNASALDSWQPGSKPCDGKSRWAGLICYHNVVTGIHLGNMGLSGNIDVQSLVQIRGLRTLSFKNNYFSGPIPELNRLAALKAIYLSGNQFSGEIPFDYFAKMASLKKVWLSHNNFTGEIPSSLFHLPRLIELRLENNQFMGTIPSIEHPTKWTSIDFSNNRLEGKIPESLSKVNESSFYGNPGLCGEKLHKACDEAVAQPIPSQPENVEESKKAAAELMTVAAVIFVFMVAAILVLKRRQKKFDVLESQVFEEPVEVRVSGPRRKETAELVVVNEEKGIFGMTDLMKAAAEALGNGSMGSSYKAVMSNGLAVAVKRMKEMNVMGREEFDAEMRRLGRLRHQNVLTPLAYHHRIDEKLLVHEYILKGSLLYLLHGDRGPASAELDWPVRLKIIHGITRGLDYLHTELASLDVPHGNLKSSNILLCTNYEPLLVDYGLNQMLSTAQATQVLFSYKSPEAMKSNQVSPKCDVYCLGIVILELLSGKFPSQYLIHGKGGIDVVQWAASAISEEREAEFFDPEITSSRESSSGMKQLLQVGVACTESDPERRLGMSEAIQRIGEIQIEGGTEARTCQLPSLRDGFPDLPGSQSRRQSLQEQQNDLSGRRSGLSSFADQSSRRTGDDFAFAIS